MWTPSAGAAEEARLRLLEPQRVCAGRPINNGVAECKCLKVGTQRCPIGVTYPTRLLTFFSRFRLQPSTAPEVPEPCRRQLRVAHGVLNILMAEVGLKCPRVVALGSQCKTAGVPQHMWMHLEPEVSLSTRALYHAGKASGGEGSTAFRSEHEGRLRFLFPLKPPQGTQLIPEDRMGAGATLLDPADVQGGRCEVDLIPARPWR